ncbi:MAG: hypothetical protein U9R57_14645 [Thermodesulfobacteriota bacterium]|nr:hypothetical protein [Thermodesulfobacteriota bacterium]
MGNSQQGSDSTAVVYREVKVMPLAARREALLLIAVLAVIILLMAVRFSAVRVADNESTLKMYQQQDRFLQNQAPTMYRSLRSVAGDIVDLREDNGTWPDVDMLKNEALPPFADYFLPAGLRGYTWSRYEGDGRVDYFGVNQDTAIAEKEEIDPLDVSFILRIIDLQNGEHPHPHYGKDSEAVQRYVSQVWMYPGMQQYPETAVIEKGWKWIISVTDSGENGGGIISEQPGK